MELFNILDKMELNTIAGRADPARQAKGVFVSDMLSDVMSQVPRDYIWVTNQVHENVIAIAYFRHLAAVILTCDHQPDADLVARAEEKGVLLLGCSADAFEIAGRLWQMGFAVNPEN